MKRAGRDVRMTEDEYRAAKDAEAGRFALWAGKCVAVAPATCDNPAMTSGNRFSRSMCAEHEAETWEAIQPIARQWYRDTAIERDRLGT